MAKSKHQKRKRPDDDDDSSDDSDDSRMEKKKKKSCHDRRRKKLSKPLTRDSQESKASLTARLRVVRLERAVERLGQKLRNYVPASRKAEEQWARRDPNRLRGAARPWEEVEAARTKNWHDVGEDLVSKHGAQLCDRVPEAREWRDALVDLARVRVEQEEHDAAIALCRTALSIDAADARCAGLLKAHALQGRDDDADGTRCIPAWTRALARETLADALNDVNPFAALVVAYPEAFDACVEYADQIGDDFAPGGKLEAIALHHGLREHFFFVVVETDDSASSLTQRRTSFAAAARAIARVDDARLSHTPEEPHKDSAMYTTMFDTALEMALSSSSSSSSPPPLETAKRK